MAPAIPAPKRSLRMDASNFSRASGQRDVEIDLLADLCRIGDRGCRLERHGHRRPFGFGDRTMVERDGACGLIDRGDGAVPPV